MQLGVDVVDDSTRDSHKTFVPREIQKWTAVVKAAGVKIEEHAPGVPGIRRQLRAPST